MRSAWRHRPFRGERCSFALKATLSPSQSKRSGKPRGHRVDIYTLREKILAGQYQISRHADVERQREDLAVGDLVSCVLSGEIVAEDTDSERGTEYLVE